MNNRDCSAAIERARELLAKATQGPWEYFEEQTDIGRGLTLFCDSVIANGKIVLRISGGKADCELIAFARNFLDAFYEKGAEQSLGMESDNPSRDCTSEAHPAWWRGHDWASEFLAKTVQEWITGETKDVGWPYAREEANKAHAAVQALVGKVAELEGLRSAWSEALRQRREVEKKLKARIAKLEAENARLYEGWPRLGPPGGLLRGAIFQAEGFWHFNEFPTPLTKGYATPREAVRTYLGIDPAREVEADDR